MKLKFICGLILLALTFGASAQFTSNSISGISASSVFGTNAPGSITNSSSFGTNAPGTIGAASGTDIFQIVVSGGGSSVTTNNVYYYGGASGFYTNTLGTNITYLVTSNALAALGYPSNKFAAICFPPVGTNLNLLYTNTANNLISTNWVKAAPAGTNPAPTTAYQTYTGTFFGAHSSVSAGSAFGTNGLTWITNTSGFSGTVGRVGIVTTNFNVTTNYGLSVSGAGTSAVNGTNYFYGGTNGLGGSVFWTMGSIELWLSPGSGFQITTTNLSAFYYSSTSTGTYPDYIYPTNPASTYQATAQGSAPGPTVVTNFGIFTLTTNRIISTNYP